MRHSSATSIPPSTFPSPFERKAEDNPTYTNYYPEGWLESHQSYIEGIFVGYRGYEHNNTKLLYPSSDNGPPLHLLFSLQPPSKYTTHATVTLDITNTGELAGADVARAYVSETTTPKPHVPQKS